MRSATASVFGGPSVATEPVASGPVIFARYAFGPNRLGLCGPEDWRALLELGSAGLVDPEGHEDPAVGARQAGPADPGPSRDIRELDRGLRELAKGFEGAYPYLALIASANGIADPLDRRVVEAYWLGSPLSDRVDAGLMSRSIEERFKTRVRPEAWRWLAGKPAAGARPTHAFHVLDVFPRVGLMRGGEVSDALGLMDACRIRWGTVTALLDDRLEVDAAHLEMVDGRLRLGAPRRETVQRWLDGSGFVRQVSVGDQVSLHWDWACEVLRPLQLEALASRTLHQLRLANMTI